ncbi:MAG: DNA replication and repair protein RecF [Chitinophagaceae bacterium]|nr:MAG: DNA replication and repair protein RecF [Chitinophagaceae bacterium]
MLTLRSISVFQYKNYSNARFEFHERVIGICGPNGTGKTNLVDAIYNLCFTKSYFNRSDSQNVQHQKTGFRIDGNFERLGQPMQVVSVLRETGKKEFSADGRLYDRLADHIGLLPAVIIAPDDAQLITGGSEERRRYMDTLFSQLDQEYLRALILYNRVMQQRNAYLKSLEDRRLTDETLLNTYDSQLAAQGQVVFLKRQEYLGELLPLALQFYQLIAGSMESVDVRYESMLLDSDTEMLLLRSREKDILAQRTTAGIHRDDLQLLLADRPFKPEASQGQRKSLLFALKLAEFDMLKKHKGFSPLLLLDDVFEKLDENRVRNLLSWVCKDNPGQIFITDTHPARFIENINALGIKYQLVEVLD